MFALIFGLPEIQGGWGGDYGEFGDWLRQTEINAKQLLKEDPALKQFVADKRAEIETACSDSQALMRVADRENWSLTEPYDLRQMKRKLYSAPGLSETGRKLLGSAYLDRTVERRATEGRPFPLDYILKRVTSLDWSVLDLFYRLTGFTFQSHVRLGSKWRRRRPICNLSLITQYLARFVDEFLPVLTADLLVEGVFHKVFISRFYSRSIASENPEYEDAEDPFPKGRIPFLTVHQSKGLEFPVVVLGNPRRRLHPAGFIEKAIYPFFENENSEPLSRQAEFDSMRMFYVAL